MTISTSFRLSLRFAVVSILGLILAAPAVRAVTTTWTSTSNPDLNTGTNWDNGAPTTSDEALFSGTTPPSTLTMSANMSAGNFIWNLATNGRVQIDAAAINHATLSLTNGGGSSAAIAAGGAAGDLLLVGSAASAVDLTFSGTTNANGRKIYLRLESDGNINVVNANSSFRNSASIQGNYNLTKTGAGTLELFATNTFGAGKNFTVQEGLVAVNATNALSSATLVMNGGNLDNRSSSGDLTVGGNNAQVWNADFAFLGTHSLNMGTGAVSLGTAAGTTRTLTVEANTFTVGGTLSDGTTANSLIKAGAGTLSLNGTSNLTGTITVNEGTLAGTGSVGNLLVASGGALSAGNSIGTMDADSLTLAAGGTFALEIDTTTVDSDLVNVDGDFSLAGGSLLTLADLGGDELLTLGTVLTFVDYSGTWNGGLFTYDGDELADGAFLAFGSNLFQIDYDGTGVLGSAVTLTAVPEPSTLGALLAGGLGLMLVRRRRA